MIQKEIVKKCSAAVIFERLEMVTSGCEYFSLVKCFEKFDQYAL